MDSPRQCVQTNAQTVVDRRVGRRLSGSGQLFVAPPVAHLLWAKSSIDTWMTRTQAVLTEGAWSNTLGVVKMVATPKSLKTFFLFNKYY